MGFNWNFSILHGGWWERRGGFSIQKYYDCTPTMVKKEEKGGFGGGNEKFGFCLEGGGLTLDDTIMTTIFVLVIPCRGFKVSNV